MEEASKNAGGLIPKTVITDKNYSYLDGIELAFGGDTEHIQSKPFTKVFNTELIERFHGTLKDRTKVMRGLKSIESALDYIDGWIVYYNYFRPHESLDNKTPAEKAKIKYPFKDWMDVIKSQSPNMEIKERIIQPEEMADLVTNPIRPYRKRPQNKRKKYRHNLDSDNSIRGLR